MKIEKFKVLLYLKKSGMDKNGKAPIMGRITVNRTMAQFSCKLSCTPSLWNPRASRLEGKSKEAVETNKDIEQLLLSIQKAFDVLVEKRMDFEAKDVKEALQGSVKTPFSHCRTPQKKVVTHRFEPTSKNVLLFIGGLALSLVLSIWGNLTQWREHQDWEEADLKYRALKMVLPSDDPNVSYIEKHFSVCRDEKVIDDVRNCVAAYEDSIRHHHEMVEMATYKDSIANKLLQESNRIKRAMKSSK